MIRGLACRITTFLAKDGAVRKKGERKKREYVGIVVRRQDMFVLSKSCGSSYLPDDIFDSHLGFSAYLLANSPWAIP